MSLLTVRRQGSIYSWESCVFSVAGMPTEDILSLGWTEKRERKVVYGSRQDGRPLGKTSGKYSVTDCKLKMLRQAVPLLKAMLAVPGLGSHGDAKFPITAQVVEIDAIGSIPITYTLSDCTIDSENDVHEEGIDELVTEFEIGCLEVNENGLSLFSRQRQIAQLL